MNLRTQIAQTTELEKALQLASEASAGMHGVLQVADGAFKGTIYFESGRVVAAEIKGKNVVSLLALQEIIQHREAAFAYDEGAAPSELKRINFPFQELLHQGLQLSENEKPADPSVVGQQVDRSALNTLSTGIKIDPSMFKDFKLDDE